MKKYVFIILLVLLFSACGRAEEESYEEELPYQPHNYVVNLDDTVNQAFLDDLDYMLHVLENNFALFDVAYWARGVDIYAIAHNLRTYIANNTYIELDDFYIALYQHFMPLTHIGHFGIVNPATHYWYITNNWLPPWNMEVLTRPHVLTFYEPRHHIHNNIGIDYERAPNVTANIIEEGAIAYLSINSFSNATFQERLEDEAKIFDFYYEIQGFDHLIIDLRKNRGGNVFYFYDAIVGPNISTSLTIDGFAFVIHGEYSSQFTQNLAGAEFPATTIRFIDNEPMLAAEILETFNLPDFNTADIVRLDYGFRTQLTVNPRRIPEFDSSPAFDGNIWVLTGPSTASSAQLAAWISKDTGFATLVGEITGGVFGGQSTYIALPNTGIVFQMDLFYVTDQYGRPLEAGTIPHHFNRPGMDALETALAIIAETP